MTGSSARLVVLTTAAIASTGLFTSTTGAVGQTASQERAKVETYDERLVRVEQQAPGFGGMFIDPEGRLAIYLVDPSQLPAARSAIGTSRHTAYAACTTASADSISLWVA